MLISLYYMKLAAIQNLMYSRAAMFVLHPLPPAPPVLLKHDFDIGCLLFELLYLDLKVWKLSVR